MRQTLIAVTSALALLPLAAPSAQADTLDWAPCPDNPAMECTSIEVPVDWDEPDGRKLTLELGRLPSTSPKPEGSVLVAYGGPGGPGIALTEQTADTWSGLRARMDVVTWDTRGYGEQFGGTSSALDCVWTRLPIPNPPPDAAEFDRLARTNWATTYPCRSKDPVFFDHLSSADHAKDMEAIRAALGEPKLNFYGASYAGFYAQAYARLFPERVRTVVLDGTFSHSADDWDAELDAHARRNETAMARFFDWCETDTSCVLHRGDVERSWRRLVARAEAKPIPARKNGAVYHYDGSDLRGFGLGMARQGPAAWGALAEAIRAAARGDASRFTPDAPRSPYPDLPTGVTECLDLPRFTSYEQLSSTIARLERIAPNTGAVQTMATNTLQCIGWPAEVTNPPRSLPKGLPPLLSAGAWDEFDAVEPVLDQVPGSGSIRHDAAGHTLYLSNACARQHIDRYFTDLVVPARRTEC